jgi:hypothetical protein
MDSILFPGLFNCLQSSELVQTSEWNSCQLKCVQKNCAVLSKEKLLREQIASACYHVKLAPFCPKRLRMCAKLYKIAGQSLCSLHILDCRTEQTQRSWTVRNANARTVYISTFYIHAFLILLEKDEFQKFLAFFSASFYLRLGARNFMLY